MAIQAKTVTSKPCNSIENLNFSINSRVKENLSKSFMGAFAPLQQPKTICP